MSDLERTLILAKLCAAEKKEATPDQVIKMAISLGELLDEFYQFETQTDKLSDLMQDPVFAHGVSRPNL